MKINPLPSQAYLKSVLDYNPETGFFTWKIRHQKAFNKSGKIAGAIGKKAINIILSGKSYYAHRLAWVYTYGNVLDTKTQIDHINCNSFDNRITNLRPATHGQNCSNSRLRRGRNLPKGVHRYNDSGKFRAVIGYNKNIISLGVFDTPELAHTAYCEAAKKYHGEFARAG